MRQNLKASGAVFLTRFHFCKIQISFPYISPLPLFFDPTSPPYRFPNPPHEQTPPSFTHHSPPATPLCPSSILTPWYLLPYPHLLPHSPRHPPRPVGHCTRCSCMRRQTSGVRSSRPQRTVPHFWRSSAGKRSTPAKCLMAGGFSTSTPTTVGASTSWRRVNTASLVTGVPSVLQSSPSGASLNDLTSIQNVKQKDLPSRFDYLMILN